MDKAKASQAIQNAGLTKQEIANRIYLATVEGMSGANQDKRYGFILSAIAELWNIRGTIGNPSSGRTKITGRYRGMEVTKAMILDIIFEYPDGIPGSQPSFDDLLGVGSGGSVGFSGGSRSMSFDLDEDSHTDAGSGRDGTGTVYAVAIVLFVILKFVLKWGWIVSAIVSLILGGIIAFNIETKWRR